VIGTPETYPFFGVDLSNEVVDHSEVDPPVATGEVCRFWRSALQSGPRLIAVSSHGFLVRHLTETERQVTFAAAPGVATELDDGDRAVYRVEGDLDPADCPQ